MVREPVLIIEISRSSSGDRKNNYVANDRQNKRGRSVCVELWSNMKKKQVLRMIRFFIFLIYRSNIGIILLEKNAMNVKI